MSIEFNQITIAPRLKEYGFRNLEEFFSWNPGFRSRNAESKFHLEGIRNPSSNCKESTARNPESMTVLDHFTLSEPQQEQNGILTLSYWTNFRLHFGLYLHIQYFKTFGTTTLKTVFKFLIFKVIPNALKSLHRLG